ncbi:MAG: hypothetical protein IT532_13780 [Burkholderiales bacterium]|nr:hypothetical protein [Burkholderiales bacterium]
MDGRKLIQILWPAFVIAGAAEAVFFTVFDPRDLRLYGEPLEASRTAIYSVGFFALWLVAAASSALTIFFQRTAAEINRCPIPDARDRPVGCPRRADGGTCS